MAHSSCFNHVKLKKLAKLLKVGRPQALGHLEFFWHYCGDCHLDGDISGLTDSDIEMASEWRGKRGAFVGAALESGFIDRDSEGTRVHDWDQWAPDYIRKRLRRRVSKHLQAKTADNCRRAADNGGQRPPEPNRKERKGKEPNNKTPLTPLAGGKVRVPKKQKEAKDIYEAYPRKAGSRVAMTAIERAIDRICGKPEPPDDPVGWLKARVESYAEAVATWPAEDRRYVPYPSTWFNQDRFDDDPLGWKHEGAPKEGEPWLPE